MKLSVNGASTIFGLAYWANQGFTQMNQLITELLTDFIAKNSTYNRKNTDSTIINVADCKTCKKRLLAVEYLIMIIYIHRTAKTRPLY